MKLTPEEETLIHTLREIDRQNPAGVDGFTESSHLAMCMTIANGGAAEARRRYRLFLRQTQGGQLVDLREAQRGKTAESDPRSAAADQTRSR